MTKVILDTDIGNEIDDMFALVYLLASKNLELKALSIEPFSNSILFPGVSLSKANEISYDNAMKIMELSNLDNMKKIVFSGATKYYKDAPYESNSAVEAMADILHKNPDTVIAAIGTPVNISLLFNIYPKLAENTKVIWLGGNGLGYPDNHEYNFSQDIEANRKLFDSCKNLTVIPCKNIASNLAVSEAELRQYISDSSLGNYLIERYVSFRNLVCNGKSSVGYAKILWDISVVAYLINSSWFQTVCKSGVRINNDETYGFDDGGNRVNFAVDLVRNSIMTDFFTKMMNFCFK